MQGNDIQEVVFLNSFQIQNHIVPIEALEKSFFRNIWATWGINYRSSDCFIWSCPWAFRTFFVNDVNEDIIKKTIIIPSQNKHEFLVKTLKDEVFLFTCAH